MRIEKMKRFMNECECDSTNVHIHEFAAAVDVAHEVEIRLEIGSRDIFEQNVHFGPRVDVLGHAGGGEGEVEDLPREGRVRGVEGGREGGGLRARRTG